MSSLSSADHSVSPPLIDIPRDYNAAHDFLERNLRAGRGSKLAYIDDTSTCTYAELDERVNRCANALTALGLQMEQRVLLCLLDSIDWPTAFLGAIKAGIVPVAVNTLLTPSDYEYMLRDSRAHALIVSASLLAKFAPALKESKFVRHVVVSGEPVDGHTSFAGMLERASTEFEPAPTTADDMCFWLYSSGSTGAPKGTVHVHSSLMQTAELYGKPILGIRAEDLVFSVPKLFFAYGLGNALSFPLSVGATTLLMAERATPDAVFARLRKYRPSILCAVPTIYAAMLASANLPARGSTPLRACVSAGEPLPAEIGRRWRQHFDVDILDGLGSTEMLHIFLSNRPGAVEYGTTGFPVPGYRVRVVNDEGIELAPGEIGELQASGPTCAMKYWNNRDKSRATFQGLWLRTGDKFSRTAAGRYVYAGRSDDMLKVSGMYVSPVEVESALVTHDAVLEAAVVGKIDADGLAKPIAYVVLKRGQAGTEQLAAELKAHVKAHLAPFKYPRWIQFVAELPKTATGKIQRFRLRELQS